MCGEHHVRITAERNLTGSSPHVRGAPGRWYAPVSLGGIIPACAGSTYHFEDIDTGKGDHPRMCGEHPHLQESVSVQWGSSPHVRGAQILVGVSGQREGIIPACAGSTRCV